MTDTTLSTGTLSACYWATFQRRSQCDSRPTCPLDDIAVGTAVSSYHYALVRNVREKWARPWTSV